MLEKKSRNLDIEAMIWMFILQLREEKEHRYSKEDTNIRKVYVFKNIEEYRLYFERNGMGELDDILEICRLTTTKKGSILALKKLCDYAITRYHSLQEEKRGDFASRELCLERRVGGY